MYQLLLKKRKKSNVIVVGNVTIDEIYVDGRFVKTSIGGGVYYSSKILKIMDITPALLCNSTHVQRKILESEGFSEIYGLETTKPPLFKLDYMGKERFLQLLSPGTVIPDSLFPSSRYNLVIINPVYHDVGLSLVKKARCYADYIALDIQGLVRTVDDDSKISLEYNETAWEYVELADIIHADYKEANTLTNMDSISKTIDYLYEKHSKDKIWIITYGENPIVVIASRKIYTIDPPTISKVVDETGAGDTFLATMAIYYVLTQDLKLAIRKSLKIIALKLKGSLNK